MDVPSHLYCKSESQLPYTLRSFIEDTPVDQHVPEGTFVRARKGRKLQSLDTFSFYVSNYNLVEPCIVMKNNKNMVTVAGKDSVSNYIKEITVPCYELSLW